MWAAWGPIGFFMLYAKRYAKRQWKFAHVAHAMCGHFVLWVTLGQQLNLYTFWQWNVRWTYTAIINTVIVLFTIILCISGQITQSIMGLYNGDLPWSRKEKVTNFAKFHRYSGYVMLFLGNLTCGVGTLNYCNHFVHNEYRTFALLLGPVAFVAFCLAVGVCEFLFRKKAKESKLVLFNPIIKLGKHSKAKIFGSHEVDEEVEKGRSLLLFDNLILDLDGYERLHPGGKFVLNRNVGRDISKFFYGGYAMVNYPGVKPFAHPPHALEIAESLVVGVMEDQEHVKD